MIAPPGTKMVSVAPAKQAVAHSRRSSLSLPPVDEYDTEIPIALSIRIRRTFDLDNVNQIFGCNAHIMMSWPTDEEIPPNMLQPGAAGFRWEPEWKPRFIIKNLMEAINVTELYKIEPNPNAGQPGEKRAVVHAEWRMLIRIFHGMDLRQFPFDVQRFQIDMEMEGIDTKEAKFIPYKNLPGADCSFARCVFEDMQLAADRKRALEFKFYETERSASRVGMSLSGLRIKMTFCRRSPYYISNVALIMCTICTFVLTAWATDDVGNRQSVDFTLLLTAVAFKLVVVGLLPPVSYFTYIDYYVLGCMLFLATISLMHSMLPWLATKMSAEHALAFDTECFWYSAWFWLIFNVIAILIARWLAATTAAPFTAGRVIADCDKELPPSQPVPAPPPAPAPLPPMSAMSA